MRDHQTDPRNELILCHVVEIAQNYKDYCSAARVVEARLRPGFAAKRVYDFLSARRTFFWRQLWLLQTEEFSYGLDNSKWAADSLELWGKTEPSWKEVA